MWWNSVSALLIGSAVAWSILIVIVLALAFWFFRWRLFSASDPIPVEKTLEGLTGMDPAMAGKLLPYGVRTDRDLMRLTPRGQQELESQLGLHHGEYDCWRREILSKWRDQFLPEPFRDVPDIIPDPELGAVYARRPKETDDLSRIQGIEKVTVLRINNAGIYTFEQLRLMMPEQRACFKQRFHLANFDFDSVPDFGVSARWLAFQEQGDWDPVVATEPDAICKTEPTSTLNPVAAPSERGESGATSSTDSVMQRTSSELTWIPGIDEQLAEKLALAGTFTEKDVVHWSADDKLRIHSQLGLSVEQLNHWQSDVESRWRAKYLPKEFRDNPRLIPDQELGAVFAEVPRHTDDLTRIVGIDQAAARKLNHAGIYLFEQLRMMSGEQHVAVRQRFGLPRFDDASIPRGGVTVRWLTSLPAESPGTALTPRQASVASAHSSGKRSDTSDESSDQDLVAKPTAMKQSNSQAVVFTPAASEKQRSACEPSSPDDSKFTIPRSRFDPDLGRLYTSQPPHRDELTSVSGISPDVAKRLNEVGIYTIDQIRSFSPRQRDVFKVRFDVPDFDFTQWAPDGDERTGHSVPRPHFQLQAPADEVDDAAEPSSKRSPADSAPRTVAGFAATASVRKSAEVQRAEGEQALNAHESKPSPQPPSQPGDVSANREPEVFDAAVHDDLTQLPNVDAKVAEGLREMGIVDFCQLADLSLTDQVKLRNQLGIHETELAQWRRLIFAWSQGIPTVDSASNNNWMFGGEGWFHSVRLTELAPGVFDGQKLVAYPEQVIFRGHLPEYWGTSVVTPREGVAKSLSGDEVRADINYIRLRRLDTRESVVTRVSRARLYSPCLDGRNGWNGLCEQYLGARHLGIFAAHVPREVETTYGHGGWGFGHQQHGKAAGTVQAYGWGGRVLPPTDFEISVGRVGSPAGTVVFRSDDPSLWNRSVRHASNNWALEIDAVTHPIRYVRIMRTDTAQAVIIEVDRASLSGRSDHPAIGWNGLKDRFHGGCHLGVYQRSVSREVEVIFESGGWGFGHRVGKDDHQAYGWAGRTIPRTIFEISVFESLPPYLREELLF